MKYKYFITALNNRLPKNQKSAELSDWSRRFIGQLIDKDLVPAFVREFNEKVAQLNEKYPRTNKLVVEWSPARKGLVSSLSFITARDMNNYDCSLYVSMHTITGEYRYAENNV